MHTYKTKYADYKNKLKQANTQLQTLMGRLARYEIERQGERDIERYSDGGVGRPESDNRKRYGSSEIQWPSCVRRYNYEPTTPHAGTGEFVDFSGTKLGSTM